MPLAEAGEDARIRPARAPLGGLYLGECVASGEHPAAPPADILYEQCNFGYGRRVCPNFPSDARADAVRFSMYAGKLIYILEKDCSPVEHGLADSISEGTAVARQAAVFSARLNR